MRNVIYEEHMEGIAIDRIARDYEYTMFSKHTHDEYEIYYLIEGQRYYFIENQTYHVKKGDLVFINRNLIHKTGQFEKSYHERALIEFADYPFSSFLATTGELSLSSFFKQNQIILPLNQREQKYVLVLFDGIADELRQRRPGFQMMTMTKLARLFFFALRFKHNPELNSSSILSTSAAHQRVTEVASYITANYATVDSLEQVAAHFYISKSYLSRIFKHVTGYTVNEYINVNRVQQARTLLSHTNLSITEIAHRLGYNSITYFEKIFRKHTETSPLKYRKRATKSNDPTRPKSFDDTVPEDLLEH